MSETPTTINLNFTMLYPVEGDSSILEVSRADVGEFLHVEMSQDGLLKFTFFPSGELELSEIEVEAITAKARQKVSVSTS